jgi:hydrogenase maturation factor
MNDISEKMLSYICQPDTDHHCLTCADEAVPVKVVRLDQEAGLALCSLWSGAVGIVANACGARHQTGASPVHPYSADPDPTIPTDQMEEIDITLVEDVSVGDILLAHAGVAVAHQEKGQTHEH